MIQSYVYQKPVSLLQQFEFVLNWLPEGSEETQPLSAVVTVSHRDGVTTLVDISVEGELPEGFNDKWNPDEAIKNIMFELGEELDRISQN